MLIGTRKNNLSGKIQIRLTLLTERARSLLPSEKRNGCHLTPPSANSNLKSSFL